MINSTQQGFILDCLSESREIDQLDTFGSDAHCGGSGVEHSLIATGETDDKVNSFNQDVSTNYYTPSKSQSAVQASPTHSEQQSSEACLHYPMSCSTLPSLTSSLATLPSLDSSLVAALPNPHTLTVVGIHI